MTKKTPPLFQVDFCLGVIYNLNMKFLILLYLFSSFNDATMIFLTIYPGTRQVAMGNSGVALTGDVSGIYYNPAILGLIEKPQVYQMNLTFPNFLRFSGVFIFKKIWDEHIDESPEWLSDLWPGMRYEWTGGMLPTKYGNLAITYSYITTGITTATDEYGNIIASWKSYDYSLGISYGYGIRLPSGMGLCGGFTLKYVYSFLIPGWLVKKFYPETGGGGSAGTIAFDTGILTILPFEILNFGVSFENMGKGVKFLKKGGERNPIPRLWRMGCSLTPLNILNVLDTTFTTYLITPSVMNNALIEWAGLMKHGRDGVMNSKFSDTSL